MKITGILSCVLAVTAFCTFSCSKKEGGGTPATAFAYPDSVLYLKSGPGDYIVYPTEARSGTYSAFPEGLEIHPSTGAINVSQSETGLRYKVTYKSPSGQTATTFVIISGINYLDKYYRLSQGDSIAYPVYNALQGASFPAGSYDVTGEAVGDGLAVVSSTGAINLAKCLRIGLFGNRLENDERKEVEIKYRINDASGNALNEIEVLMYYYETMNDVPADIQQLVLDHQKMIMQPSDLTAPIPSLAESKPRPPCVIIVGD